MALATGQLAVGAVAPGGLRRALLNGQSGKAESSPKKPMPKRPLGRTGYDVSLLALGGKGIIDQDGAAAEAAALRIIERAIDLGVNYIDTSPHWGNGVSEARIGGLMKSRRKEVFLASGSSERSYDGTLASVEQSLKRLQTDHLDLYQLHDVRQQQELEHVFSRNGAVRAMQRLRDEGTVRFLGIAGSRDPAVLLSGIQRYPFDVILMSLNAADIHFKPFQTELLQTAVRDGIGIMAMNVTARGRLFRNDGLSSMEDAMGYVFSLPVSGTVIGVSHPRQLEQNVKIATRFEQPYNAEQLAAIERLTEPYQDDANRLKIV